MISKQFDKKREEEKMKCIFLAQTVNQGPRPTLWLIYSFNLFLFPVEAVALCRRTVYRRKRTVFMSRQDEFWTIEYYKWR